MGTAEVMHALSLDYSNNSIISYYHDVYILLMLSLINPHNHLLNWYDDPDFTEQEYEYRKGQYLVKVCLTQPTTSLVAPLQSGRLSRDI